MSNQYTKPLEWHKRVYMSLQAGIPSRTLAKNMNVDISTINTSYYKHFKIFDSKKGTLSLGTKQQPYFTESEMIQGFKVNVSELSKWELSYLESL